MSKVKTMKEKAQDAETGKGEEHILDVESSQSTPTGWSEAGQMKGQWRKKPHCFNFNPISSPC